jgi:hypothetical protein
LKGAEEITFGNVLRLFPIAGFVYELWRNMAHIVPTDTHLGLYRPEVGAAIGRQ